MSATGIETWSTIPAAGPSVVEGEADLHRDLPVGDLIALDVAAHLAHLEPAQVVERLRRLRDRLRDRVLDPDRRRAGDLDRLVHVLRHGSLLCRGLADDVADRQSRDQATFATSGSVAATRFTCR